MTIAENGTMAFVADAGGAAIGAWQANRMQGFAVRGEVGTPYWFELFTLDYDRAVGFYRQVFRWDAYAASDTPEFRYTTLGQGEGQLGATLAGRTCRHRRLTDRRHRLERHRGLRVADGVGAWTLRSRRLLIGRWHIRHGLQPSFRRCHGPVRHAARRGSRML